MDFQNEMLRLIHHRRFDAKRFASFCQLNPDLAHKAAQNKTRIRMLRMVNCHEQTRGSESFGKNSVGPRIRTAAITISFFCATIITGVNPAFVCALTFAP